MDEQLITLDTVFQTVLDFVNNAKAQHMPIEKMTLVVYLNENKYNELRKDLLKKEKLTSVERDFLEEDRALGYPVYRVPDNCFSSHPTLNLSLQMN